MITIQVPALRSRSVLVVLAVPLIVFMACTEAFQTTIQKPSSLSSRYTTSTVTAADKKRITTPKITTELQNIFGNLFGQQSKQEDGDNSGSPAAGNDQSNAPVVTVMDIPAKVIKIKPLKFYMQLFLVSQQNTPFEGAWLLNANEEVEDYLEIYFRDGTGMILVQFDDLYGIHIQRKGQRPSLQYMLQESVLLHALLDELEAIAFGTDDDADEVDEEKRLLQFTEENKGIISKVRDSLPARAA